jgi:hypothetical protein
MRDQQVTEPSGDGVTVTPELLEAVIRAVAAMFVPQQLPPTMPSPQAADFLTAKQFARRLGISHDTAQRLAIAGVLPRTVVCRGATRTTRRFPRRFTDEFAASGLGVANLAEFATAWLAQVSESAP